MGRGRIRGVASFRAEGIIIKRRNLGETDRVLTVFTKNRGKLSVLAKGVRKVTSRRAAAVDLLCYAELQLYEGRTFFILTEAKLIDNFPKTRLDLEKIKKAFYICEILDGLLPEEQEHEKVFEEFLAFLKSLAVGNENLETFVGGVLRDLGYGEGSLEERRDNRYYIEELLGRRLRSLTSYGI